MYYSSILFCGRTVVPCIVFRFCLYSASSGTEDTKIKIEDEKIEEQSDLLQPSPSVAQRKNLRSTEYKCETCNHIFKKKCHLLEHQRIHTNERPFVCEFCGRHFTHKGVLLKHQKQIHSNERPFPCNLCGVLFKIKYHLKRHIERVHAPEAKIRSYCKCQHCDKAFWTKHERDVHQRTHTGECPYICEVCGKLFKSDPAIRQHMKQVHNKDVKSEHTVELPHKCQMCGKSFKFKCKLLEHERIHTKERPHECTICGKVFRQISGRNMHVKIVHSGDGVLKVSAEPKHKCSVCDKAFWRPLRLVEHLRLHSGERPFECHVCGNMFRRQNSMKVHVKNVHNKV